MGNQKSWRKRAGYANLKNGIKTANSQSWYISLLTLSCGFFIFRLGDTDAITKNFLGQTEGVQIKPSGHVSYWLPVHLITFCPMRMDRFPFDRQICHITMASWIFSDEQLKINIESDAAAKVRSYAAKVLVSQTYSKRVYTSLGSSCPRCTLQSSAEYQGKPYGIIFIYLKILIQNIIIDILFNDKVKFTGVRIGSTWCTH